jgi:hypothetical protein
LPSYVSCAISQGTVQDQVDWMFAACKCVVKIKVAAGVDIPDGLHFVVTASGGVTSLLSACTSQKSTLLSSCMNARYLG